MDTSHSNDKMTPNVEAFVNSLDVISKDTLYRYLWAEHVREDVRSQFEDEDGNMPENEPDAIIEAVTDAYVYDGDYDCNLSYWENINNLIKKMSN